MKKIDLHIHTVPSIISDSYFEFSMDALCEYVAKLDLHCIAITNHNLFDLNQFKQIASTLTVKVFPGIEIDLEGGHMLLLSENEELIDFNYKCSQISSLIRNKEDSITLAQFNQIFPDLKRYLLIPHYDKKPNIPIEVITELHPHITSGEVTSTRKFKACLKDSEKLTPVIFSDARMTESILTCFPTRQTYVDLAELSLKGIKYCLNDKSKVFLTEKDGNSYFQATDDGLKLSTGLNVILGERSTGKTHTLNRIVNSLQDVKYIKQFSLLQNDEEKFKSLLSTRHSTVNELFLKEFKQVVADVKDIDLKQSKLEIEKYLTSLLKFAIESDKQDSYSKAVLFSETLYPDIDVKGLAKIIEAVNLLIENKEHREVIDRHVSVRALKDLSIELMLKFNEISESNLKRRWINGLTTIIRDNLRQKTSTTPPLDVDFYEILIENEKVKKFIEVAKELQKEREIDRKDIRDFKVVAKTRKYTGAQQMKNKSGRQLAFSQAFLNYDQPYRFLRSLKEIELEETDYHKYFVEIEYKTLNKHNFEVSGGERSEFNLLHEISDALQHDLLLIDEPESYFDNLFLKNDVNNLLKEISKEIPVVIVTHNSTVGASISPDYIIFTKKTIEGHNVKYQVFQGHPSSKQLTSLEGEKINNYEVMLKCLEAGQQAYDERRTKTYEILKN